MADSELVEQLRTAHADGCEGGRVMDAGPLRMGELFAGYGGLGLGVEQALAALGHDVERVWVSEFDPAPSRILAHHWPDVPNLGDITKIDWTQVLPVDVLTGGFPCQDVSLAGARAGMRDGTRSGLWSYMAAAIAALRPRLVVIENVRGLLSAPAGKGHDVDLESCPICVGDDAGDGLRALGAVLGDLADLGFDAEWGMLEAAAVGATHHRARVFIVAWPAADPDSDEPERWGIARRLGGAQDTHQGAVGERQRLRHATSDRSAKTVLMPTPTAAEHTGPGHAESKKGAPNLRTVVSMLPTTTAADSKGSGGSLPSSVTLTDAVTGRRGLVEGAARELLPPTKAGDADFGDYQPAIDRWTGVIGRPAPAPTETGPKGAARLSPLFVEWMMGLPEGHVTNTGITRAAQLKALGNGVVPQQAAAAVAELLRRAA